VTHATASARLSAKLDLVHGAFGAYARKLWSGPDARIVYPVYLRVMHAVVRSAVPLMEAALAETARGGADVLTIALGDYYAHHKKEEAGHDRWLLEDLAETGHDPSEAEDQIPPPAVASMVGAQYYWIRHFHPVALLGHIAAIEAYHPPAGFARRLADVTGYPMTAFRAIARHEVLDIHHRRDLFELIDRIPLKAQHEKMMAVSGMHTVEAGIDVLEFIHATALRERAESREPELN
jgi:hypothetical protein